MCGTAPGGCPAGAVCEAWEAIGTRGVPGRFSGRNPPVGCGSHTPDTCRSAAVSGGGTSCVTPTVVGGANV
ncbi:peptidase inhibitor family I36 protein [Micromonospora sp. DH13]|uniref:peptidase inhibitor family I36 protein n=1 Tax=Micromonospora sp. DH13 TaxID=2857013 RepID=UPI0034D606B6